MRWNVRSVAALALTTLATTACTPPAADAGAAAAESPLTDAQIAHVAVTANSIDVELARLAESRASAPGVLAFARTMISDHTAVNEQAAALAGRLGVTPETNPVSESLLADAAEVRRRLEGLRGEAFDRAYMEREVAYHEAVLGALDGTLIPGASNGELRALLQGVRPAIEAHLEHARMLDARPAARTHVVEIREFRYQPASLTVAVGDTVVWVNRDAVSHTATAVGGEWDSGDLPAGASWSQVVGTETAGEYICTVHPAMRGRLSVRDGK